MWPSGFSKLEIILCAFMADNNFINALIPHGRDLSSLSGLEIKF
ncbi:hypothetical protein SMITH_579 [Smithella sp. ME-1]|uniref:Uncharacterized protein n=1 Tax=hydrocarbon metagenome TaxID=938273 RepID=A0A0W8FLG3_9ZZZZ|nr:hypothetical protein SMITH_579 [Smithella sp. ME-1]